MAFDAYRKWLGISSKRRPPTYYDLLGVEPGENDNDVIVSALQQRRSFIRSKIGEGYDEQVKVILVQIDEAASTLLVAEFKDAYDRQLGLKANSKRKGSRRPSVLPTWMETRIVRIYGEGSGLFFEAFGIISIIFAAIVLMVLSGLWFKTQTTKDETSTEELTWLELAAIPPVKKADVPDKQAVANNPAKQSVAEKNSNSGEVFTEKRVDVDPKLGSTSSTPLPKAFLSKFTAMEFVLIPSGTFMMGSPDSEAGRAKDETLHQVTISRQFYLGKFEVTQAEFQQVMSFNPSKFTGSKRLPVENVTWFDAVWYCNELSKLDGYQACYQINNVQKDGVNINSAEVVLTQDAYGYRLPTEAEWEYACRAGTTTAFSFGDNVKTFQVNYDGKRPYNGATAGTRRDKTIEVDAMKANAWGLRQMHGNVWEWCHDWEDAYGSAPVSDPYGPSSGLVRVGRGGTWDSAAAECRSAQRIHSQPGGHERNLGFRVALVPPPQLASANSPEVVRDAPVSKYPVSSIVDAKNSRDNHWHSAKVVENWESLHLCHYESIPSDFDEWVTPERIRPSLAGDWLGNWQNDADESGRESLKVKQDEKDFIMGIWSGNIQMKGERIGPSVIFFEAIGNQRQYQCVGFLQGDRLRLEYRAHRQPQGGHYYGWEELKKIAPDGQSASDAESLATPKLDRRGFTGSWSGTFVNSNFDTGTETLRIVEKDDALAGELSGIQVSGLRMGSTTFHLAGTNGRLLYDVVGRFEQDHLILHYTATSKDERYFGQSTLMNK